MSTCRNMGIFYECRCDNDHRINLFLEINGSLFYQSIKHRTWNQESQIECTLTQDLLAHVIIWNLNTHHKVEKKFMS